jgi:hypothetical protein
MADALFVDASLIGEEEARQRVLALWTPGARVRRLAGGLLLRLPSPRRTSCSEAPGAPLVASPSNPRTLSSAPLDADEFEALAAPAGSLVLVREGAAQVVADGEVVEEDLSAWLDVQAFRTVETAPLGEVPPPPVLSAPVVPSDLRTALGDSVPPPAEGLEEMVAALRRSGDKDVPGGRVNGLALVNARLRDLAGRALARIGRLLGPRRGSEGDRVSGSERRALGPAAAPGPLSRLFAALARILGGGSREDAIAKRRPESLLARLRSRLSSLAARLLATSHLARYVGRKQAEYIGRMMEMFERGDLTDALRHAIPLGGAGPPGAPSLSVPTARDALTISPEVAQGRRAMGFGDALYDALTRLYRDALHRLENQGRIEEAAFVLAELLRANEEAVAFLERHGRLRLSAEIAEARALPPGLVVRQWFLAGDPLRAVAVARRTGAFADAVLRLERTHPDRARSLRLIWADSLADAGDYPAAVEAAWPLGEARGLAREWIERSIDAGGPAGARMLLRKLALLPASLPAVLERVRALCEDESPEESRTRQALGAAVIKESARSPALSLIAKVAARALLRDRARFGGWSNEDLKRLVALSGDAAFATDFPRVSGRGERVPLSHRPQPWVVELQHSDSGTLPVWDAALLPGGRVLAALGEAGARLLTRDGRIVAHFDEPAHRLVLSDHGTRAILLAPRGEASRLSRVDLTSLKAATFCEARVDAFALDFDGSMWFLAAEDTVMAVDAMATRFQALWRVTKVGGRVASIARAHEQLSFLVLGERPERWTYELPRLTLRTRAPLSSPVGREPAVTASGRVIDLEAINEDATVFSLRPPPDEREIKGGYRIPGIPFRLAVGETLAAVPYASEGCCGVDVIDLHEGSVRARFVLGGARRACARMQGQALVLGDDRGRILVLDLESGQLLRDLRV